MSLKFKHKIRAARYRRLSVEGKPYLIFCGRNEDWIMQNVNLSSIYLPCHKPFYELLSSSTRFGDPFRTYSHPGSKQYRNKLRQHLREHRRHRIESAEARVQSFFFSPLLGKQHKIDKWHSFTKGGRHRVVTWKFFGMMWATKILSMFYENMINFRHFLNSMASFSATSFRTSTRTCRLIA